MIIKRMMALLLALCLLLGTGALAEGELIIEEEIITMLEQVIEKNIPQEEALDKLIELIKRNGDWTEE